MHTHTSISLRWYTYVYCIYPTNSSPEKRAPAQNWSRKLVLFHNLKGHGASSDRKVASQRIADPTKIPQKKTLETTKAQNRRTKNGHKHQKFQAEETTFAWKGKSHYRLKHQSHTGKAEQPMVWKPNFFHFNDANTMTFRPQTKHPRSLIFPRNLIKTPAREGYLRFFPWIFASGSWISTASCLRRELRPVSSSVLPARGFGGWEHFLPPPEKLKKNSWVLKELKHLLIRGKDRKLPIWSIFCKGRNLTISWVYILYSN